LKTWLQRMGAERVVLVLICAYVIGFVWLARMKWSAMSAHGGDLALYSQVFYHTLHGRWFYCAPLGANYFGNHLDFLLVALLPFYWLFPSFYVLVFAQAVAIGFSGAVLFRIARRAWDADWQAVAMALAFLMYPTVATMHLDGFHGEVLALPFLFLAFQAYEQERFGRFMLFLVLAFGGQENIPLTCFMFGPYALLQRRGWKWVLAPMLAGALYLGLALGLIMPWLRAGRLFPSEKYLSGLGDTPAQALWNCLTNPGILINSLFTPDRGIYLLLMLQPLLLIVPLFASEAVLVIPNLLMNLIVASDAFRTIPWHYNSTVGACLCLSAVFGVKNLQKFWDRHMRTRVSWLAVLPFGILAASVSNWPIWFQPADFATRSYHETQERVLSLIPHEASVLAPVTLQPHLADRGLVVDLPQFSSAWSQYYDTWPHDKMLTIIM
jgi:uncharacterized membrane protein